MCWEHLLFFHVWADEIEKRTSLMRENEASLSLDQRGHVDRYAASQWFGAMADEMAGMVKAHDKLLNVSAPQSFGPPGTAGDAESIIRVATTLGSLFESMLQWVQRIRWTDIDEPFTKAGVELAKMPTLLIERVRRFPNESLLKLESAIAVRGKSGAAVKLDLTLDVGVVDTSACMAALREAERKLTWSPRVNNAQELVDQQLAALRQESERMRQHYETEATREQAEANAALSKALEELEPLRKYEGLRDAEVEVQRQLADAVKEEPVCVRKRRPCWNKLASPLPMSVQPQKRTLKIFTSRLMLASIKPYAMLAASWQRRKAARLKTIQKRERNGSSASKLPPMRDGESVSTV